MIDFFIWLIHIVSLVCYGLLLVVFGFSKKDRLVKIAILMMLLYVIWAMASLFMRFDGAPGTLFWNGVMATVMIILPLFVYHFMACFSGCESYPLKRIGYVGAAVSLVLYYTGQVISQASVQMIPQMVDGRPLPSHHFEVKWEWGAIIVFMYVATLLALGFVYCLGAIKKTPKAGGFKMVFTGNVIVFAAIVLTTTPWLSQCSLGILAGVINAVLIMISIYRYRVLEFKFAFIKGAALLFIMGLLVMGYIFLSLALDDAIKMYVVPVVIACSICGIYCLYLKFNRDIDKIFISTEYQQRQWLCGFSVNLANKLELDEITDTFLEAVRNVLRVRHVCLALYDRDRDKYIVSTGKGVELAEQRYVFAGDNPMATWLNDNSTCLTRDHIQTLPIFKALWDSEIKSIDDMDLELAVPLKSRSHLIGMLILSGKQDGSVFTMEDTDLLLSLGGSTAVALDNAFSYERAKSEANTDSLTGLFNHRYFYRELRRQIQEIGENLLSLVLLDLDMFKLYNDMYGHMEGDKALETVAEILKLQAGEHGVISRYGGEEFVIILPFYDSERAEALTERIRQAVQRAFYGGPGDSHRFLSISAGICTYPQAAPNGEELLKRADIALYSAKNSGKNRIVIYGPNLTYGPDMIHVSIPEYQEYGYLRWLSAPTNESISHSSAIFALTATIETKDYYTYGHSQKVAEYASVLASAIGLDDWHVKAIMEAALLHDIGKIGIPEDILKKGGRLTEDELEIMRRHVDMSVTIIKHLPTLQYVLPAVVGHHENWDGSGYPRNICGENIPISARCLAIADSFDAMMSTRPYRSGCSLDHALREMREKSGTQFDPSLVDIFVDLTQSKQIDVTPFQ